ncbi:protein MpaA [Nocardioides sp. BE266]|uniref:M14 family zinc carboxypeptidase n=1 Tax=Nocardioides sp. BE266 TaxID=2817725 RepID=UPI00285A26A4|nr:M14 family zinc carboxypeptidase [Nocardioides sp. BE266]MDR7252656.1 protein MpaA [Nocardioides sp. BE266]
MRRLLAALGLLAAGLTVPVTTAPATAVEATSPGRPAVVEVRTIGHSVRGRPIRAWRLGEPGKRPMVLISTMHGNEPHTRRILETLRDGRAIRGVDLWVVPTYNPDGLARHSRRNAHGVDLNRNFPFRWADLDGNYESGPRPASEPETRAMMAFLREINPRRVLSFHQPLVGVDTDTKDPGFARKVARALRLPRKSLDCGGLCHGTMTMWFNHHFAGSALTVEYGARPPRRRMVRQAPGAVLHVLGAHRTSRG